MLSKSGMITLKIAAQAIPIFRRNLFLIPSETCKNVEKQMNGFWCGDSSNRIGIRWMSGINCVWLKRVGTSISTFQVHNITCLTPLTIAKINFLMQGITFILKNTNIIFHSLNCMFYVCRPN